MNRAKLLEQKENLVEHALQSIVNNNELREKWEGCFPAAVLHAKQVHFFLIRK